MELPTLTLSDGRVATYTRKPKAKDTSLAKRIAGPKGTDIDLTAALLAQVVQINGAPQTMEDLLGLDLDDFANLGALLPGNFTQATSN